MKNIRTEIKWAVIFIITKMVWLLLERLTGLHGRHIDKHPVFTNLFAIPAVTIYVLALLDKRKRTYGGVMAYRQGFVSGLILTLIITLLTPLNQYITSTVITPGYFSNAISYAVSSGKLTQSEAEGYFNLKSYIVQGTVGAAIMGVITTAIVALFVKRKPIR